MAISCAISTSAVLLISAGLAQGGITFNPATTYAATQRPEGIAVTDLNRDGIKDLAVSTDTPDRIQIRFGRVDGTFGPASLFAMPSGSGPAAIVAGDFDGDGDPDLAIVLKNTARVGIMTNNGSGFFVLGSVVNTGANPIALISLDIDNDGDLDLATADRDSNTLTILRNNGVGVLSISSIPAGDEPKGIAAADLNGDTLPDLVSTSSRDRTIRVALNLGNGVFGTPTAYSVGSEVRPEAVALADVNGDGRIDVIASASSSTRNQVLVLAQLAGGAFAAPVGFSTGGTNPGPLVCGDFDIDGDIDVSVANQDSANIAILANTNGTLGTPALLACGATPSALVAAPLHSTGNLDLIVSERNANTVSIFANVSEPPCPSDINQDGVVDLFDYLDFVSQFAAGTADFNLDGLTDFFDYLDFVATFAGGC